jgi:hypothetical protein
MKISSSLVVFLVFGASPSNVNAVTGRAVNDNSMGKKAKSPIPDTNKKFDLTYFIGFWEGVDGLDGADTQHSMVLVPGKFNNFTFLGCLAFFQICALLMLALMMTSWPSLGQRRRT